MHRGNEPITDKMLPTVRPKSNPPVTAMIVTGTGVSATTA